eukprot:COSAG06_NODE_1244_length_10117_cov_130.600619_2_plen_75_part_00
MEDVVDFAPSDDFVQSYCPCAKFVRGAIALETFAGWRRDIQYRRTHRVHRDADRWRSKISGGRAPAAGEGKTRR